MLFHLAHSHIILFWRGHVCPNISYIISCRNEWRKGLRHVARENLHLYLVNTVIHFGKFFNRSLPCSLLVLVLVLVHWKLKKTFQYIEINILVSWVKIDDWSDKFTYGCWGQLHNQSRVFEISEPFHRKVFYFHNPFILDLLKFPLDIIYVHSRVEKSSDETVGEHAMSNKSFVITTFLVRYNYLCLFPNFVFVISTFLVRVVLSLSLSFFFLCCLCFLSLFMSSPLSW